MHLQVTGCFYLFRGKTFGVWPDTALKVTLNEIDYKISLLRNNSVCRVLKLPYPTCSSFCARSSTLSAAVLWGKRAIRFSAINCFMIQTCQSFFITWDWFRPMSLSVSIQKNELHADWVDWSVDCSKLKLLHHPVHYSVAIESQSDPIGFILELHWKTHLKPKSNG